MPQDSSLDDPATGARRPTLSRRTTLLLIPTDNGGYRTTITRLHRHRSGQQTIRPALRESDMLPVDQALKGGLQRVGRSVGPLVAQKSRPRTLTDTAVERVYQEHIWRTHRCRFSHRHRQVASVAPWVALAVRNQRLIGRLWYALARSAGVASGASVDSRTDRGDGMHCMVHRHGPTRRPPAGAGHLRPRACQRDIGSAVVTHAVS